jgi:hypothetical protein
LHASPPENYWQNNLVFILVIHGARARGGGGEAYFLYAQRFLVWRQKIAHRDKNFDVMQIKSQQRRRINFYRS